MYDGQILRVFYFGRTNIEGIFSNLRLSLDFTDLNARRTNIEGILFLNFGRTNIEGMADKY
jgi:hypothetical protein